MIVVVTEVTVEVMVEIVTAVVVAVVVVSFWIYLRIILSGSLILIYLRKKSKVMRVVVDIETIHVEEVDMKIVEGIKLKKRYIFVKGWTR